MTECWAHDLGTRVGSQAEKYQSYNHPVIVFDFYKEMTP
jgi:hypothetical protein